MQHVFISYVSENKKEVDRLYEVLMSYGIRAWLDQNDIPPGLRWKKEIRRAIQQGFYFIACFSREYHGRDKTYMNEELKTAIDELRQRSADRVWFVPIKLNECEIPDIDIGGGETLQDLQYVSLYEDWNAGIQRILNVIQSEQSELTRGGSAVKNRDVQSKQCIDVGDQDYLERGSKTHKDGNLDYTTEDKMGLADWFRTFCSNIQVQDGGTISTRYKNITRRLNTDFWDTTSDTSHSLYVGSYGRNTAIEGFSDLDMIFRLPDAVYKQYDEYKGNGQSALLQAVKKSIEKTYSTTSIRADGQVILVPFTDGITFEVVPAFSNTDDSYTYPDANDGGRWRVTDPKPEIEAIRTRNNNCNYNLVRLCRMMRAWKGKWYVPMGGLLVDTLAYQFINDWKHKDKSFIYYDWMCRDFFLFMADQDEDQEYWRAPGSGQYVYSKGQFRWKAKRCYNISLEAIDYEQADPKRKWSAKQKWREIFGTSFPN